MIMRRISYSVAAERIEENREAAAAFIADVSSVPGARYTCFQVGEDGRFMHIAEMEDEAAAAAFQAHPAFQPFVAGLKARCVEGPDVAPLDMVAKTG